MEVRLDSTHEELDTSGGKPLSFHYWWTDQRSTADDEH